MIDTKAKIDTFNVFQLQELARYIAAQMTLKTGKPHDTSGAPAGTTFRRGDLIEFFSSRHSAMVRCTVERVNGKSLSCHQFDKPAQKWRVSPGLARLVGADKVATVADIPAPAAWKAPADWVPVTRPTTPATTAAAPAPVAPPKAHVPGSVPSAGVGRW